MKRNQLGYYNFDFKGLFVGILIVGIVVGVALSLLLPWLWGVLKPLIHALTA